MAKYCGKCGSKLDPETGLCPKCNAAFKPMEKAIAVCVIGVLLIGALIALLLYTGRKPEARKSNPVESSFAASEKPIERDDPLSESTKPTAADVFSKNEWKDNVLMADIISTVIPLGGYRSSVQSEPVFGSAYMRGEIGAVVFHDSTTNAPNDCWDVSDEKDGSVLAWVVPGEGTNIDSELYALHIAADGGINGKLACKDLFCGYSNLVDINFNNCFHTEDSDDFSRMFYGCRSLQELDLTGIQTGNARSTSEMFAGCSGLIQLDVRTFDTSNVTDMSGMFSACDNLVELDISGFSTSSVTDVSFMFFRCPASSSLDLTNFDTSKVNSYGIFMDEGIFVNGKPWEELFPSEEEETESGKPKRTLVDTWDTGGVKVSILSSKHLRVELTESRFESKGFKDGKEDIFLYLYHDTDHFNCYEIMLENRDQEIFCYCGYLFAGSAANSYHPKDYTWSLDGTTLTIDLYACDIMRWSMLELEKILISHYSSSDSSTEELCEMDLSKSAVSVQFQYFIGPDDAFGGKDTEKASIVGLDADGNPVWTHLTDVKHEIYQSARIVEIGYVNGKYYYTDDDTLMILSAETGEVIRRVTDFGSNCTDCYIDSNGYMYFCCYMKPCFIAMDKDGNILRKIDSVGEDYYWAYEIDVKNGYAYVTFDQGPDPYSEEDYTVRIDLDDYSYKFV